MTTTDARFNTLDITVRQNECPDVTDVVMNGIVTLSKTGVRSIRSTLKLPNPMDLDVLDSRSRCVRVYVN